MALAERLAKSTAASTPEPRGSGGEPVPAGDLVPAAANLEKGGMNAYTKPGKAHHAVRDSAALTTGFAAPYGNDACD